MSSRGRNHTRGTMQAWREMAMEDGPPLERDLFARNARWRPIVRLIAKQEGWRFIDAYLHTCFKDFPDHLLFGSGLRAPERKTDAEG